MENERNSEVSHNKIFVKNILHYIQLAVRVGILGEGQDVPIDVASVLSLFLIMRLVAAQKDPRIKIVGERSIIMFRENNNDIPALE